MTRRLIKIAVLVALIVFLLLYVSIKAEAAMTDVPEYQDVTVSVVISGHLFCMMNDTNRFEYFGNIGWYDWWLDDGVYFIFWSGNVLEDEQEINRVYDPIQGVDVGL